MRSILNSPVYYSASYKYGSVMANKVGNCVTLYLSMISFSELLTSPKSNLSLYYFDKALKRGAVDFLSVNMSTLYLLGSLSANYS